MCIVIGGASVKFSIMLVITAQCIVVCMYVCMYVCIYFAVDENYNKHSLHNVIYIIQSNNKKY